MLIDVIIVGGGLAGLGVAYESRKLGKTVAIIERSGGEHPSRYGEATQTGASYKNAGMLNLLKPLKTITNSWQQATVKAYAELGVPLLPCGMNLLVDSPLEALGVNMAWPHRLHGATLKRYIDGHEPNIKPHIIVFRDARAMQANPEQTMQLVRAKVEQMGCEFVFSEPDKMSQNKDGTWSVMCHNKRELVGRELVVAAGAQTRQLMQQAFGLHVPLVSVLGLISEFAYSEKQSPWFNSLFMGGHSAFAWGLHGAMHVAHLSRNQLEVTREQSQSKAKVTHLYVSHGPGQTILVGGPRIELKANCEADDCRPERYEKDMQASIDYARQLLNFPPSARKLGTWSGLMAFPEDDMPLVGPVAAGLWLCTGFASAGFREAFGAGQWLARLMFKGEAGAVDVKDNDMIADWRKVLPGTRVKRGNPIMTAGNSSSRL